MSRGLHQPRDPFAPSAAAAPPSQLELPAPLASSRQPAAHRRRGQSRHLTPCDARCRRCRCRCRRRPHCRCRPHLGGGRRRALPGRGRHPRARRGALPREQAQLRHPACRRSPPWRPPRRRRSLRAPSAFCAPPPWRPFPGEPPPWTPCARTPLAHRWSGAVASHLFAQPRCSAPPPSPWNPPSRCSRQRKSRPPPPPPPRRQQRSRLRHRTTGLHGEVSAAVMVRRCSLRPLSAVEERATCDRSQRRSRAMPPLELPPLHLPLHLAPSEATSGEAMALQPALALAPPWAEPAAALATRGTTHWRSGGPRRERRGPEPSQGLVPFC
mmetsp:Transcript_34019/g.112611  ORF Transcript_34019/g.112611 Transcript_34019/m.112611 type:complete len:326 (+) Transcript_34019:472-1449(+)